MKEVIVSAQVLKSAPPVAEAAPIKPANRVILTGDLTEKATGEFIVTTHNIGYRKGSTDALDFVEEHPVIGDASKLEIGTRVTVTGFIGRIPRGKQMIHRLIAVTLNATPDKKYDNRVMVAGRLMGGVNKLDEKAGKDPMGWMFIDTSATDEPMGVRAVLFGQMLDTWYRKGYPNRECTVFGWLNNRPRWTNDGDKDIVTEIRPDPRTSELHGPDKSDPAAAFADESAFAPAAVMAFSEPQAQAEAPEKPSKSKKAKAPAPEAPF